MASQEETGWGCLVVLLVLALAAFFVFRECGADSPSASRTTAPSTSEPAPIPRFADSPANSKARPDRARNIRPESPPPRPSLGPIWEENFNLCSSIMRRQGFRTESFIRDECEALATAAGRESLATMVREIERCVAAGRSESACMAAHPIIRRLPLR